MLSQFLLVRSNYGSEIPTEPPERAMQLQRVHLIATRNRKEGVTRAFAALAPESLEGKRTFVKPNFNTADPTPGSTHNDTLEAILGEIRSRGPASLGLGDRSAPETAEVLRSKGIHDLASRYDATVIDFDELGDDGWVYFGPEDNHWPEGFHVAGPVLDTDYLVWTPCLKTHQFGGVFTMSLKLAVGVVPKRGYEYMSQLHSSPHQRRMIAEINAKFSPDLVILDGVQAFVDGGPATGELADTGVFIAGYDRIAVDAVGLAVLKNAGTKDEIADVPIFEQEQMARAVELDLGITGPDEIEITAEGSGGEELAANLRDILARG